MQLEIGVRKPEEIRRPETSMGEVMGGLRSLGYDMDGAVGRTNGSIAKRWLKVGLTVDEILRVAEGFSWLTRRWALAGKWQGPPALRPLYSKKLNDPKERTPLWRDAEIEWNDRNKRAPSNLFAKGRIRLVIE